MNMSIQPISEITRTLPITGWEEFLDEGEAFLKTATAAHARAKKAFTPEILYNIIAMAIEKFVMAALMQRGALPYNHTMTDLVEAFEEFIPSAIDGLKQGLLDLDSYQEICDVDSFKISPPAPDEIPGMLELAEKLRQLVYRLIHEGP